MVSVGNTVARQTLDEQILSGIKFIMFTETVPDERNQCKAYRKDR
jgi:hypothetical protein